VDVLFTNPIAVERLTGKAWCEGGVDALLAAGAKVVAVKNSEKGCAMFSAAEHFEVPPFAVEAVDTTGAGDSFDAGFIAGRLAGFSLRASVLLGNALGGLATTVIGAGTALPGKNEVLVLLNEQRGASGWKMWREEMEETIKLLST
jgi:sugar/nucleoside kinase (ribokinase family)